MANLRRVRSSPGKGLPGRPRPVSGAGSERGAATVQAERGQAGPGEERHLNEGAQGYQPEEGASGVVQRVPCPPEYGGDDVVPFSWR